MNVNEGSRKLRKIIPYKCWHFCFTHREISFSRVDHYVTSAISVEVQGWMTGQFSSYMTTCSLCVFLKREVVKEHNFSRCSRNECTWKLAVAFCVILGSLIKVFWFLGLAVNFVSIVWPCVNIQGVLYNFMCIIRLNNNNNNKYYYLALLQVAVLHKFWHN